MNEAEGQKKKHPRKKRCVVRRKMNRDELITTRYDIISWKVAQNENVMSATDLEQQWIRRYLA